MNILIPILLQIIMAVIGWLILRRKTSRHLRYAVMCSIFGVILISVGSLLLFVFNGKDILLANLLLQDYEENGRFVFIGYAFLGCAFLLLAESLLRRKEKEADKYV